MNGFRPESHVAQQSRRDKLRVQQVPVAGLAHLVPLPRGPEPDPDLIQVRPVKNCDSLYDPALFSSGMMLDFSASSHVPSTVSEALHVAASQNPSFGSHLTYAAKVGDPQSSSFWKTAGSQPSCDWIMNYENVSESNPPAQSPLLAVQVCPKLAYCEHQDEQSPLNHSSGELSGQYNQRQYGELPMICSPSYQNSLHELTSSSSPNVGSNQVVEMASLVHSSIRETGQQVPWGGGGNELLLLPSYADNAAAWMNRLQAHPWSSEGCFVRNKGEGEYGNVASHGSAQGLALSLASNPPPDLHVAQIEERFDQSRNGIAQSLQNSKVNYGGIICPYSKFGAGNKGYGSSVQGVLASSMDTGRRSMGPLGPFTGYATILKSSKFLKPAQQLLDEFCSLVMGSNSLRSSEQLERTTGETSATCGTVVTDNEVSMRGGSSVVSSSSFYSSTEGSGEGHIGAGTSQIHRPEFQQRKDKLLFMQEEVCRRYKQYHQQMQMVVSSFESVAGLSAATPYTSLALKAVSKHFRCLKNAISEQLRHISKVLGEEFMSLPGSIKGDTMTTPKLKFIDQALRKDKASEHGLGFLDHNQPVWRPQRGLPERSVAVLRAWLFEHFLHPYPTDSEKHMLASQTGLSRNQVSNWFINARVRLWKPMVEEIHTLETKGLNAMDLNSSKGDGNPLPNKGPRPDFVSRSDHQSSRSSDCSSMYHASDESMMNQQNSEEQWHREKRSRMEHCSIPATLDGGLMGFSPYQGGIEIGGLEAVSLTLGLTHNEGTTNQQQQQMRHFGSHMLHDFVG